MSAYTNRFNELVSLCPGMVTPEYKKIERYIWGLPPSIQGNVAASKPTTIQEAIRLSHDLMDQLIRHTTKNAEVRFSDNKRKWDNNLEGNYVQLPYEKPNTTKIYAGNKPVCHKCDRHHYEGPYKVCEKCKKVGHLAKDCRTSTQGMKVIPPGGCHNCGEMGHFRRNCPKLMNRNVSQALGRAFIITEKEGCNDHNLKTGTFPMNNYASFLFNVSGDKCFVCEECRLMSP
uniref:uncharacterized protein LOC122610324 n=1 Tax=Erigeron canadensis TaxID=72917 RepID=UPI001CB98F03|nr:uncharacterized protein LOC122610324 [Erigeron canadensis]